MSNQSNDIWSFTEDDKKIKETPQNFNQEKFPFWERIKDNQYNVNKKILVKQSSPEIGLGIFTMEKIKKNDLIERAPIIQLGWKSNYLFEPQIHNYCWINNSCTCEDCRRHGYSMYMPLGYGGIYNHQDDPNAQVKLNYKNLFMDITAVKDIPKGQEIFINYGAHYFKNRYKHKV